MIDLFRISETFNRLCVMWISDQVDISDRRMQISVCRRLLQKPKRTNSCQFVCYSSCFMFCFDKQKKKEKTIYFCEWGNWHRTQRELNSYTIMPITKDNATLQQPIRKSGRPGSGLSLSVLGMFLTILNIFILPVELSHVTFWKKGRKKKRRIVFGELVSTCQSITYVWTVAFVEQKFHFSLFIMKTNSPFCASHVFLRHFWIEVPMRNWRCGKVMTTRSVR